MKANILVCGPTGAGKTTLIQALTKFGTVPDENIGIGGAGLDQFTVYETDVADFIDADGLNPGQSAADYRRAAEAQKAWDPDAGPGEKVIHAVWYCVDGSSGVIDSQSVSFIKTLDDASLTLVTKSDEMTKEESERLLPGLREFLTTDEIVVVSAKKQTGLKKLLERTWAILEKTMKGPDMQNGEFKRRWDLYYEKKRNLWKERVGAEADELIRWAAGRAAVIALVPLPLADVAPLIANEAYMIKKMAGIYGYTTNESIVTMLGGVAGGSVVGKALASFLPGLKIPIAAAVTYGVGKAAKAYFESDMKLDVSVLKEKFEEAKDEAKLIDWEAEKDSAEKNEKK
ncbi:MAG: GTP-binding DUF697 domain-containing protein [Fusobacteriaceae bacterium]|nr:GTP-binding DUF697 domain-containing protein [Fusobacteriaceae bacterium]